MTREGCLIYGFFGGGAAFVLLCGAFLFCDARREQVEKDRTEATKKTEVDSRASARKAEMDAQLQEMRRRVTERAPKRLGDVVEALGLFTYCGLPMVRNSKPPYVANWWREYEKDPTPGSGRARVATHPRDRGENVVAVVVEECEPKSKIIRIATD